MDLISYNDFTKVKLKVGTIKSAEDIPGKDKLYLLKIDVGEENLKTLMAGIKQYYTKDELINKQVIVLTNLEPRAMAGHISEGMILAAVKQTPNGEEISLLTVDDETDAGTQIF